MDFIDKLMPLLQIALGGIIAIVSSIITLKIQGKQNFKNEELQFKRNKYQDRIEQLKKYYLSFSEYFGWLKVRYSTFLLIVNNGENYKTWITQKNEGWNYNFREILLSQKLFFKSEVINDFYSTHLELQKICCPNTKKLHKWRIVIST